MNVSVALGLPYAMRMRRIFICDLSDCTSFFSNYLINSTTVERRKYLHSSYPEHDTELLPLYNVTCAVNCGMFAACGMETTNNECYFISDFHCTGG